MVNYMYKCCYTALEWLIMGVMINTLAVLGGFIWCGVLFEYLGFITWLHLLV